MRDFDKFNFLMDNESGEDDVMVLKNADEEVVTNREEMEEKYEEYVQQIVSMESLPEDKSMATGVVAAGMAAGMLKDSPATELYSERLILTTAKKIRTALNLDGLSRAELERMARSSDKLQAAAAKRVIEMYSTPERQEEYIQNMQRLYRNMAENKNRNAEYANLVKKVKVIASMNPADAKDPEKSTHLIKDSFDLMRAIDMYTKGRSRVQTSNTAKENFSNAMDALSIVNKYVPGTKDICNKLVDRINNVRLADTSNKKELVDLEKYGASRAEEAARHRESLLKNRKLEHKQEMKPLGV